MSLQRWKAEKHRPFPVFSTSGASTNVDAVRIPSAAEQLGRHKKELQSSFDLAMRPGLLPSDFAAKNFDLETKSAQRDLEAPDWLPGKSRDAQLREEFDEPRWLAAN